MRNGKRNTDARHGPHHMGLSERTAAASLPRLGSARHLLFTLDHPTRRRRHPGAFSAPRSHTSAPRPSDRRDPLRVFHSQLTSGSFPRSSKAADSGRVFLDFSRTPRARCFPLRLLLSSFPPPPPSCSQSLRRPSRIPSVSLPVDRGLSGLSGSTSGPREMR